jgi:hypothetical protein
MKYFHYLLVPLFALFFSPVFAQTPAGLQGEFIPIISDAWVVNSDDSLTTVIDQGQIMEDGTFVSRSESVDIPMTEVADAYRASAFPEPSFVCNSIGGKLSSNGYQMACEGGSLKLLYDAPAEDPQDSIEGSCSIGGAMTMGACRGSIEDNYGQAWENWTFQSWQCNSDYNLVAIVVEDGGSVQGGGSFSSTETPFPSCVNNEDPFGQPDPEDKGPPAYPFVSDEDLTKEVHIEAAGVHKPPFEDETNGSGNPDVPAIRGRTIAANNDWANNYTGGGASGIPTAQGFSAGTAPTGFDQGGYGTTDDGTGGTGGTGGEGGTGGTGGEGDGTVVVEGDGSGNVTVTVNVDGGIDCETNPNALACQDVTQTWDQTGFPDEPVVPQELDAGFNLETIRSVNSCPQPDQMNLAGMTLAIDLQPFCNGLVYISPIFKMLFAFMALGILTGGMRSS